MIGGKDGVVEELDKDPDVGDGGLMLFEVMDKRGAADEEPCWELKELDRGTTVDVTIMVVVVKTLANAELDERPLIPDEGLLGDKNALEDCVEELTIGKLLLAEMFRYHFPISVRTPFE